MKKILILLLRFFLKSPITKSEKKNVINKILIYCYTGIGNLILYTPALKALKKQFPNAQIDLIIGSNSGCEKALIKSELIDNIIDCNFKFSFWKKIKIIYSLRKIKYDVSITPFGSIFWLTSLINVLGNIPIRVGHITSDDFESAYDFIFNNQIKMERSQHEIDRYLDLVKVLGCEVMDKRTFFSVSLKDEKEAEEYYEKNIDKEKIKIGIQCGSSENQSWKRWPNYEGLINKLLDNGFEVVLFGSESEIHLLEKINIKSKNKPVISAGQLSLNGSGALMKKCELMITNDSGLMHIADALEVPLIAIYGPTDYVRTMPLGEKSKILRLDLECSPCYKISYSNFFYKCKKRECLENINSILVYKNIEYYLKRIGK